MLYCIKQISHTGNSFIIFGYNGRDGVITDVNGLLYMRSRYYSPELRRFVNADILHGSISDSSSLNRYAYVNGNPVSFVDPFGLEGEESWWSKVKSWASEHKGWATLIGLVAGSLVAPGAFAGVTTLAANMFAAATTVGSMAFAALPVIVPAAFAAVTTVGSIALAQLPGAVLTGGVAGGLVGGVTSSANGNSFWGGFLAGGLIGTLFSLGNNIGVATAPMMPLISTAAFGLTAFVGIAETIALIDSYYQVNKYKDSKWSKADYDAYVLRGRKSTEFDTPEKRMKLVNYLYDEGGKSSAWTKAQMYRELKYHYAGTYIFPEESGLYERAKEPDFEEKQIFETYIRRFAGNIYSIFYQ